MSLFGCSCKKELESLRKDLKDFKELVDIERFAGWVRLLQDATVRINNYHSMYKETMQKIEESKRKKAVKETHARPSNI